MFNFDDFELEPMGQDAAVLQAMESVDKGLFDYDETKDEDLEALYER